MSGNVSQYNLALSPNQHWSTKLTTEVDIRNVAVCITVFLLAVLFVMPSRNYYRDLLWGTAIPLSFEVGKSWL